MKANRRNYKAKEIRKRPHKKNNKLDPVFSYHPNLKRLPSEEWTGRYLGSCPPVLTLEIQNPHACVEVSGKLYIVHINF